MSRVLPILFNTDMVRAILDGRKTVTRRIIKPQPPYDVQCPLGYCTDGGKSEIGKFAFGSHEYGGKMIFCKPQYQPGDILYVRETWSEWTDGYLYKAWSSPFPQPGECSVMKWHPSIHMPKKAARIYLKVTNVRVERLCNMLKADFLSEGLELYKNDGRAEKTEIELEYEFEDLWNSTINRTDINRYGWDASPWVWVIEFERCENPVD